MLNTVVKWGVAAAAVGWASAAGAVPLDGSIAFGSVGILPDPGSLATATTFNAPTGTVYGVASGNFLSLTNNNNGPFGSVTFSSPINVPTSGTVASAPPLTITGTGNGSSFGMFTASTVEVVARQTGFLDLYFLGTYSPAFGGYDPNESASLRLSLTRTGNTTGGYSTSVSATLAVPPAGTSTTPTGVPEPASMAILGAGLLGLGLARRRKAN